MVRTHSGLGNGNGNQQSDPPVVEHVHGAIPVVKPVIMEMLKVLLAEQREEMRQLIQEIGRQPTMSVIRHELNEEQYKEGNYIRTVSRLEPQVVRRNNLKLGIK